MSKNIIQISTLGSYGRFGNQLYQYAFAKAYARSVNCILEIPSNWIGRKIFKIQDASISRRLPKLPEDYVPKTKKNIDLFGYFQKQECLNLYSKKDIKNWFQIKNEWLNRIPKREDYYIAAHLRRGDYKNKLSHLYCIINKSSYIKACEQFDLDTDKIIWFSEENPNIDKEMFRRGFPFLRDFIDIMRADVILRANSSFSWWAAALSNAVIYSPVVGNKVGRNEVHFIAGNSPKFWSSRNKGRKLSRYIKHTDLEIR